MNELYALDLTNLTNAQFDKSHEVETSQFDILKVAVRQLNRIVIACQSSVGDSLRNGKNYWFTSRDHEKLVNISNSIQPAVKAFNAEIEHNLETLYAPDAVDRKKLRAYYYSKLLEYNTSVDSFSANVNSLTLTINGLYDLVDHMDEEDIKDTYDQLPSGIYLGFLGYVKLVIEGTKTTVMANDQLISDLKDYCEISLIHTTDTTTTKSTYSWKGDKTDLAELVWALIKSNRIVDNATGQSVTQIALVRQLETLLGIKLDVPGLMKGRMNTYKMNSDGKSFTSTLQEIVNERAASA